MYTQNKIFICLLIILCALGCLTREAAAAANSFTVTMTTSTPDVTMGDPAGTTLTYSITNGNGSAGNVTQLQFTAPTGFTWQGCGALPSGWTCGAGGTVSLTISAGTPIAPGSTLTPVPLILNAIPSLSGDNLSGTLATVKATFSKNPKNVTNNTPASTFPRVHSLLMTLVPSVTSVLMGGTFTLTMTVTNKSTSTQNTITSSPKPPTPNYSGGASVTTSSIPANLSLGPGVLGTMTWTYTATATGTVSFTATATNVPSGGTATSIQVTSAVVTIGSFIASIVSTPACLYSGSTATFTMKVTNGTGGTINTVAPSALTKYVTGTAAIGAFTGPTPASIASLANGVSGTFTWTATVTGSANDTYYVTGFAASGSPVYTTATATSNTENINGYNVSVAPMSTYAGSKMQDLTWTITNYGCDTVTNNPTNINNVAIAVPAGWTASTDGYALVTNTALILVDTWTLAGTTFTSPTAADRIPYPSSGNFDLLFSATPSATGTIDFNITVTDDTGTARTMLTTVGNGSVTVNPFNSSAPGQGNYTIPGAWRESY